MGGPPEGLEVLAEAVEDVKAAMENAMKRPVRMSVVR